MTICHEDLEIFAIKEQLFTIDPHSSLDNFSIPRITISRLRSANRSLDKFKIYSCIQDSESLILIILIIIASEEIYLNLFVSNCDDRRFATKI